MSSVGEADVEKAHFFVISKVYLCRMAQHLEKSCTKEKDAESGNRLCYAESGQPDCDGQSLA